jgi:hypothetical protein
MQVPGLFCISKLATQGKKAATSLFDEGEEGAHLMNGQPFI